MSEQKSIKISPVDYSGTNLADKSLLLDAPAGEWMAQCLVEAVATKPKPNDPNEYPMLKLTHKLLEDLVGGNEMYVGRRVTEYIVLYPPGHANFQMQIRKLHALCAAADVPVPHFGALREWPSDGQEFIDSIDRASFKIWTVVELDRKAQPPSERTSVRYEPPRTFAAPLGARPLHDDE